MCGGDSLWDGAGCGPLNDRCTLNNPPWFHKQLPSATTDDRILICGSVIHSMLMVRLNPPML